MTAAARAPLPGYICVVSKTHVSEPFDLPPNQQAAFWLEREERSVGVGAGPIHRTFALRKCCRAGRLLQRVGYV